MVNVPPPFLLIEGLTFKRFSATLGTHKAVSIFWRKFFSTKCGCKERPPFQVVSEKCGLVLCENWKGAS